MGNIDSAALDYRSLTLPKIKRRLGFKKPKKPSGFGMICLLNCVWTMVNAIQEFVDGRDRPFAVDTLIGAIWWHLYREDKARSITWPIFFRWYAIMIGIIVIDAIAP